MDRKGFSALLGDTIESGKFPGSEAWLPNFTEAELRAELTRRQVASQASGSVAVRSSVQAQIESMLPAAYDAYCHNTTVINNRRAEVGLMTDDIIPTIKKKQFVAGAMDALDAPALAYMESVKESNMGQTLWVPKSAANAELSQLEIIKLAEVNASYLQRPLSEWGDRLKFLNLFMRSELSGNNPISEESVSHQFAPSTLAPRLYGTAQHQRNEYKALRAENPGVNIHAPALAHSVGGWAIHADSGLALPVNYDATYDRSIEVDKQSFFSRSDYYTPGAGVTDACSSAYASWVGNRSHGRAWVGQNLNLAA